MQTPEMSPQPRVRLVQARNDRHLSQQELADLIGSNYVNVSRWERGITRPSPYFRRKLCEVFGKQEQELDLLPARPQKKNGHQQGDTSAEQAAPEQAVLAPLGPPPPIYDPAIPLQPAITLIGRDGDLERIKRRLCGNGKVPLTALNGLPGVGKTALSITLAHDPDIRARYKDGVLWAGLGPTPNMPGLLSRWGGLLGISQTQMANLSSNEAWARAIRNAIGERAMLLVIDDAWQLEEALTFRVGGSNCTHLVTTRFPGIATAMTVDGATMIEELGIEDSINLLGKLAPQVIQREQQRVRELVHAVGGLPLALTLMGNYLRKQAYSGPARRISTALERLNRAEVRMKIEEPHVPAESHPSLPIEQSLSIQSVVAVTDQLLDKNVQDALYALSVLPPKPNTFSEEAALSVAACSTDELDALSDAGMLESTGTDRYQIHQVIADYARLQIKDEQHHKAQERLVHYVVAFVEEHRKDYEQLEQESSIIQAALEIAHTTSMAPELIKAVGDYAPFLIMRGFYDLAESYLKQSHEAAVKQNDKNGKAIALLYLGEVAQKRGNYAQAESNFQDGLQIAREAEDEELICAFLGDLGDIKWRMGDYRQSEVFLQESLQLAKYRGNKESVSKILKTLGTLQTHQGNYKQASTYFQEGLILSKQIEDREQSCFLLSNLGAIEGMMGNFIQAESYFKDGLVLARQIGHREQICMLLLNIGSSAADQKHYEQANSYLREGLTIGRQIGHRESIGLLLLTLGSVAIAQDDLVEAEKDFEEAITLVRQLNRPSLTANALIEFGKLHIRQGKIEEAEKNFKEVFLVTPEGSQDLIAIANYGLAQVAAKRDEIQKALMLGNKSLTVLESIGHSVAKEVKNWLTTINK